MNMKANGNTTNKIPRSVWPLESMAHFIHARPKQNTFHQQICTLYADFFRRLLSTGFCIGRGKEH